MEYTVDFIRIGWTKRISNDHFSSACTISLLKGPKLILIDPGSPWDSLWLLSELQARGISPLDIDYLICTHGHIDHIGSLHIFPDSTRILGTTFEVPGQNNCFSILRTPFEIDSSIHVIATPGHTQTDISIIIENIHPFGRVAIVGDLYECEQDINEPSLWQSSSDNLNVQQKNRQFIFDTVDFIVPGHGSAFKVPKG
ncbi:unnamed protein product [Heterobilharzia americana]|nr:unnamed protein product [Heterobilharzia americana]